MKYNDWVAVMVVRGKKDVWSYVTFLGGFKLRQFLTAEKAETVLVGLRATNWKESCFKDGNKEVWKFTPQGPQGLFYFSLLDVIHPIQDIDKIPLQEYHSIRKRGKTP